MDRCLTLAERGIGHVSPNPAVGAVLVGPDGRVLGEGWHAEYGEAHAERMAIEHAQARYGAGALRTATLYVNLEPCNHHGKTPPCTDLILDRQIPRVVVGMIDPNPRVAGEGVARLRTQGVDVTVGVRERACWRLNEAFVHHLATGRPLVRLKIAQTLDGRIATTTGESRWVTGRAARRRVHQWRAMLDGVLVGTGTARADNPQLTVRHVEGRQPTRIVLDRQGHLPEARCLFTDTHAARTLAVVGEDVHPAYAEALRAAGGRMWRMPEAQGHLDLAALLDRLGTEGGPDGTPLQSLLVEAGPGLATALLAQDLVDRLHLFIAPKLLGDGVASIEGLGIQRMADAVTFAEETWETVGSDLLFTGYRTAAPAAPRTAPS